MTSYRIRITAGYAEPIFDEKGTIYENLRDVRETFLNEEGRKKINGVGFHSGTDAIQVALASDCLAHAVVRHYRNRRRTSGNDFLLCGVYDSDDILIPPIRQPWVSESLEFDVDESRTTEILNFIEKYTKRGLSLGVSDLRSDTHFHISPETAKKFV